MKRKLIKIIDILFTLQSLNICDRVQYRGGALGINGYVPLNRVWVLGLETK